MNTYEQGYQQAIQDASDCLKKYSVEIPIDVWLGPKRELIKMFALRAAARLRLLKPEVTK